MEPVPYYATEVRMAVGVSKLYVCLLNVKSVRDNNMDYKRFRLLFETFFHSRQISAHPRNTVLF